MFYKKYIVSAIALAFLSGMHAYAWELPKVKSLGGSSSASAGSAKDVARDARNALYQFAKAELKLAEALGGYENLAANKQLLENIKTGDAAASKADLETISMVDKSVGPIIDKKIADNTKLDATQKALAAEGTMEYVSGLVSTKKLAGSVSDLASNPAALGLDAGPVLFLAKELPVLVPKSISASSSIIKYMSSNGVDVSKAKEAASDMGK